MDLNPNYADAHHYSAHYFEIMGKTNEALAQWQKAWELDPLSPIINSEWGWSCYFAGLHDQAIQHGRKALEFDPNFLWAYLFIAQSLEQEDRYGEALGVLNQASTKPEGDSPFIAAELAWVQAALGRKDEAQKKLSELMLKRQQSYVNSYYAALIHRSLGDTTQTLNWLETAYEERSVHLPWRKLNQNSRICAPTSDSQPCSRESAWRIDQRLAPSLADRPYDHDLPARHRLAQVLQHSLHPFFQLLFQPMARASTNPDRSRLAEQQVAAGLFLRLRQGRRKAI